MRDNFVNINNPKSTFTPPLLIAAMVLLMGSGCRAGASSVSHNQLEKLAQEVTTQSKALSVKIEAVSAKTKAPTTAQIKSLIPIAQKYFFARTAY